MRIRNNKINLMLLTVMCSPLLAIAQGTATNSKDNYWYNPVVLSLVGLMLVLLFAIGVMGNVLKALVVMYREKEKREKENNSGIAKTVLLFLTLSIPVLHSYAAEETKTVAIPVAKTIGGISPNDFYTLISIVVFEMLVLVSLLFIMRVLLRAIHNAPVFIKEAKVKARSAFWDKLNNAVSVEKEMDVLLDHNYDGIKELDNPLPPWWKYGFYITIAFACIYLYRFQISHEGLNPTQEYEAEVQQAKVEQAAYLANAANNVDENSVTALTDAPSLGSGKAIFESTCAACHLKDGGGIVGPNLTDDYWLHGGSIKDIFKTIKYGWQDKGMKSWKDDFSPVQIQQIASYVKSLHGTHPATPKDKQGELYIEAGVPTPATDTPKIKTDDKKVTLK